MSIQNFIQAEDKAGFEEALGKGKVTENQIAFIESDDLIWARGKYYGAIPDNEDLTKNKSGELQLSDRSYSPENFSGKGYKILRKNMVAGKNVLAQEMITDPNTIYEIRYDYDLEGAEITIPEGCMLKFEGGSLNNGTLNGNDTDIKASCKDYIFKDNLTINGSYVNSCFVDWFGNVRSNGKIKLDSSQVINKALNSSFNTVSFNSGYYYITNSILLEKNKSILLEGKESGVIYNNNVNINGTIIWTDKDIDLLIVNLKDIDKELDLNIHGGQLDSSYVDNHTKSLIKLVRNKCNIHPYISTFLSSRPMSWDNLHTTTGTIGVLFDEESSDAEYNGSFYGGEISSNMIGVDYGVKVNFGFASNGFKWLTSIIFSGYINGCKYAYDFGKSGNEGGLISGDIQPIWVFKEDNEECLIKGNLEKLTVTSKIWDIYTKQRDFYSARYACESPIYPGNYLLLKDKSSVLFPKYIKGDYCSVIQNNNFISPMNTFDTYSPTYRNYISLIDNDLLGKSDYKITTDNIDVNQNDLFGDGLILSLKDGTDYSKSKVNIEIVDSDRFYYFIVSYMMRGEEVFNNNSRFNTIKIKQYLNDSDPSPVKESTYTNESVVTNYIRNITTCCYPNNIKKVVIELSDFVYNKENGIIIIKSEGSTINKKNNIQTSNSINLKKGKKLILHDVDLKIEPFLIKEKNNNSYNIQFMGMLDKEYDDVEKALADAKLYKVPNSTKFIFAKLYKNVAHHFPAYYYYGSFYTDNGYRLTSLDIIIDSGATDERPLISNVYVGFKYFDTTLGKFIYKTESTWVDSDGNPADAIKKGTSSQRPVGVKAGFYYFDTDINKPIWKKEDTGTAWVDSTGIEV